mmetsp:Transcript_135000/g.431288  ORF Transcript_135000/g.431288 Transcript_135000/m.431288 type:complete len:445 (-) Transcript_135000:719-2053(-)
MGPARSRLRWQHDRRQGPGNGHQWVRGAGPRRHAVDDGLRYFRADLYHLHVPLQQWRRLMVPARSLRNLQSRRILGRIIFAVRPLRRCIRGTQADTCGLSVAAADSSLRALPGRHACSPSSGLGSKGRGRGCRFFRQRFDAVLELQAEAPEIFLYGADPVVHRRRRTRRGRPTAPALAAAVIRQHQDVRGAVRRCGGGGGQVCALGVVSEKGAGLVREDGARILRPRHERLQPLLHPLQCRRRADPVLRVQKLGRRAAGFDAAVELPETLNVSEQLRIGRLKPGQHIAQLGPLLKESRDLAADGVALLGVLQRRPVRRPPPAAQRIRARLPAPRGVQRRAGAAATRASSRRQATVAGTAGSYPRRGAACSNAAGGPGRGQAGARRCRGGGLGDEVVADEGLKGVPQLFGGPEGRAQTHGRSRDLVGARQHPARSRHQRPEDPAQ